jgi:hypothetical protein
MEHVLREELETYSINKDHLLRTAPGKFVLIHKDQVVGTFDTRGDAISQGYRQFGNVPFLTKKIEAVEEPVILASHLVKL